jgi:hypothetical protein
MKTKAPLIALSILAATAFPVAQADAKKLPKTAYFQVRISASQHGDWTEDYSGSDRFCGVWHASGHGTSKVSLGTNGSEPVTVKRTGTNVRFLFPQSSGPAKPDVGIGGSLERYGESQGNSYGATSVCPKPERVTPDCGVRSYQGDARLALMWNTPANWPTMGGRKPHSPSLHLRGPYGPSLVAGFPSFLNCVGERDDYQLGIPDDSMGVDSGPVALSLKKLFSKKVKQFTVRGHIDGLAPHVTPTGVTGAFRSHLSLLWTVNFKRLSHPGKPDPIKPVPLT